jgi:hypothetical protein
VLCPRLIPSPCEHATLEVKNIFDRASSCFQALPCWRVHARASRCSRCLVGAAQSVAAARSTRRQQPRRAEPTKARARARTRQRVRLLKARGNNETWQNCGSSPHLVLQQCAGAGRGATAHHAQGAPPTRPPKLQLRNHAASSLIYSESFVSTLQLLALIHSLAKAARKHVACSASEPASTGDAVSHAWHGVLPCSSRNSLSRGTAQGTQRHVAQKSTGTQEPLRHCKVR